ncbi:hypothetical protein BDV93DRAFT_566126 [Ceratobasidium sp. AG-I]|nr:hypothetical protein BDV93DRAFT_566126 [Ceratobasidium sp. AG-I]
MLVRPHPAAPPRRHACLFSLSDSGKPPPRLGVLASSGEDEEDSESTRKGLRDSTVRARQSTDPPGVESLPIDTSCEAAESKLANNKHAKRTTASFIVGLDGLIKSGEWQGVPEPLTISTLLENNTDGFVKVVNTVLFILERLPESLFSPAPSPAQIVWFNYNIRSFHIPSHVSREQLGPEQVSHDGPQLEPIPVDSASRSEGVGHQPAPPVDRPRRNWGPTPFLCHRIPALAPRASPPDIADNGANGWPDDRDLVPSDEEMDGQGEI